MLTPHGDSRDSSVTDVSAPEPCPQFIVAGAPKSATTSLYNYLGQHPLVFLTGNKEPRYFAYTSGVPKYSGPGDDRWASHLVSDSASYRGLFRDAGDRLTGEASTDYLYLGHSARAMHDWNPDLRLIFLLRDPVHRAYSNYLHLLRLGLEPHSFEDALRAESRRIEAGWAPWWHYIQRGFYGAQLRVYLETFSPEQIHVEAYQSLRKQPHETLLRICRFLDLSPWEFDVRRAHNASLVPRGTQTRWLRGLVSARRLHERIPPVLAGPMRVAFDRLTTARPPLAARVADTLARTYQADQVLLRGLLSTVPSSLLPTW